MRKDFGCKTYLFPMPVLMIATYSEDGTPDIMNAAWGGIADYDKVGIYLSADHKTTANIFKRKAYTVSMGTAKQLVACDYVGIVSANDEPKKFEKSGFHAIKSEHVDAPLIEELGLTLECEFLSWDEELGLLIGKIVNVSADDSVLDENGKIDITKVDAICYDPVNHNYVRAKEVVGHAFKDGLALKK